MIFDDYVRTTCEDITAYVQRIYVRDLGTLQPTPVFPQSCLVFENRFFECPVELNPKDNPVMLENVQSSTAISLSLDVSRTGCNP